MVKGTSRQVILVRSPDQKLFEQAIFIVREDAQGISDDELLQEACRSARQGRYSKQISRLLWTGCGAAGVAAAWLLSVLL